MKQDKIRLTVNGSSHDLSIGVNLGEIAPSETLVHTLRETLGLTGAKESCDHGACGCCTVIMDGQAVPSCMVLTVECHGKEITTIEGLQDPETEALDPLQQSFIDNMAFQCGYCTPGIIMTSKALLEKNPRPDEEEIKEALAGNFCRCISQYQVIEAVKQAAKNGR
ncbi:putative carbon-monoxide dehydrogenase (acceptor), small subunit [delta proteobacterium NaphS2]|nr:putative carbon-monoxide dehydrogenase (acceptor), small subunit [delta proteobacterium NaphS2]